MNAFYAVPEPFIFIRYAAVSHNGGWREVNMTRATHAVSLPTNRAFVVQLSVEALPAQGKVGGRVEHVVSMKAARFHSSEELMSFMARVLAALEADDDTNDLE
jgi:hypothetical protein